MCVAETRTPAPPPSPAEALAALVRANYDKQELRVPMRDGTTLYTAVYTPKDRSRSYPILLRRTPYSCAPYGADAFPNSLGPSAPFAAAGYIFAIQDVRGTFMSDGEFVDMRPHRPVKAGPADFDESTDTYDTVAWLTANIPGNNGRVGMTGVSYPGWLAAMAMLDPHPALRAVSPQASPADMWMGDDFHHNGAFRLSYGFEYATMMESGKDVKQFAMDAYDTYEWYLRLGSLANVNSKLLKGSIPTWKWCTIFPVFKLPDEGSPSR